MNDLKNEPVLILAFAIIIPLGIAALFWGGAQIIVALGTACGIVVGMFSAGAALGDLVEVWAIRTAAIGLGAGGVTVAFKVIVNITQQVKNDTFAWTLPVVAILVGLLAEIDKEFYQASPILKHLLSAVFAFIVLVGGYLFTKHCLVPKACALVLMFSPPVIVFVNVINTNSSNVIESLAEISFLQWFTIIGITCLAAVVAVLGAHVESSS